MNKIESTAHLNPESQRCESGTLKKVLDRGLAIEKQNCAGHGLQRRNWFRHRLRLAWRGCDRHQRSVEETRRSGNQNDSPKTSSSQSRSPRRRFGHNRHRAAGSVLAGPTLSDGVEKFVGQIAHSRGISPLSAATNGAALRVDGGVIRSFI